MLRGVFVVVVLGIAAAPLGWIASDRLESRNDFCVACHLGSGRLHARKLREFETPPASNLAALHAVAEPGFRCIDCHGGASFPNKLRVKAVAARDALRWLLGRFREPVEMAHPLWDEDCTRCHPDWSARRDDDFHAFDAHNVRGFAYACVSCHRAHPVGAPAEHGFLERPVVTAICRNCHEET